MERIKPKPTYKKVLSIFEDIQEEGYYTFGFDKGEVPTKITIDQGSAIKYDNLRPLFIKAMDELKSLGFHLTFHVNLASLSWDDKNLVDNRKLLYQDTPIEINLSKYQTKSQYLYQKPKPVSIWSIDIHLDHPSDGIITKIKRFANL